MTDQEALLLTVEQAARQLGLGRSHMYELLMAQRVRSVKIGRCRRVPAQALQQFIADLQAEA